MRFVQLIEYSTHRIDEVTALLDEWATAERAVSAAPGRAMLCADRDNPDTYLSVVEFSSHEDAMDHSAKPETAAFAERLRELCDGDPTFRNLDVLREGAFETTAG